MVRNIVLIKDNLPRGSWKIGLICQLVISRDGQIRSGQVMLPNKKTLNRALNMLYPIECEEVNEDFANTDTEKDTELTNDNTTRERPQRQAARAAMKKIKEQLETIYPTADSSVTCTAGSRHGSHCEFACSSSAMLNGTKDVTCERHKQDGYGYWTWQNQQPFCQDAKRCREKMRAPDNGAIACDYWLGGSFCHMFCQHEYDVPIGEGTNVNGMFVCGQSGKWNPSASVPNCAKFSNPKRHHYQLNVDFRFTGNCHDSDVIMEIQQKFIDTWKTSNFKEGCLHEIDKCIPSNIQVRCGGLTGKRSTTLSISFYIQMDAPFDVEGEIFANLTQQQYNAVQRLKNAIHNGRISIDLDNNSTLHARDLTYYTLEMECDGGTVLTQNRQGCVKCVPGTFYRRNDKTCISCPRGTYQPDEGHFTCRICPNGTSTRLEGSTDISNCEVACSPGSWSAEGIPPCTYCPKGTYQDIYGGNECEICPNSTTTEIDGGTDVKHCIDGVQNIKLSLKDNHISLGYNGTEKFTSAKLLMKKWYTFMLKMSETELLVNIDGESIIINHRISLKEQHGKITVDKHSVEHLICLIVLGGGFTGRISQLNIFDKDTELLPFKSCTSNAMGDILSWKDFEELVAPDIFIDVPSDCDDKNECDSNPCLNGNCTDELNGFSCQCFYGFYGDNCENNIDDCDDNACDNNGTCIDGAASYDCDCQPGFTGQLCEIKTVDGEWGEWGNWSSCSLTCGNGTMTRMRYCNRPTPDNGGSYCIGNHTEYATCMDVECLGTFTF
ncbi:unnamed protein product [Mytilus coruscus]|uniref:EGF-like domain-containing protein n=1 Tax=Mytilus coruscus TaxID=42192 RepID=A0A6J7ZUJ7_MYTCO|nr:unnamed protein product [Mytilus coruscus]